MRVLLLAALANVQATTVGGLDLDLQITPPPRQCTPERSWGRWVNPPAHQAVRKGSHCWIRVRSNLVSRIATTETGPPSCEYQYADLPSAQRACVRRPWCGGITYLSGGIHCDGCYKDAYQPIDGPAHYELRYGCPMASAPERAWVARKSYTIKFKPRQQNASATAGKSAHGKVETSREMCMGPDVRGLGSQSCDEQDFSWLLRFDPSGGDCCKAAPQTHCPHPARCYPTNCQPTPAAPDTVSVNARRQKAAPPPDSAHSPAATATRYGPAGHLAVPGPPQLVDPPPLPPLPPMPPLPPATGRHAAELAGLGRLINQLGRVRAHLQRRIGAMERGGAVDETEPPLGLYSSERDFGGKIWPICTREACETMETAEEDASQSARMRCAR